MWCSLNLLLPIPDRLGLVTYRDVPGIHTWHTYIHGLVAFGVWSRCGRLARSSWPPPHSLWPRLIISLDGWSGEMGSKLSPFLLVLSLQEWILLNTRANIYDASARCWAIGQMLFVTCHRKHLCRMRPNRNKNKTRGVDVVPDFSQLVSFRDFGTCYFVKE